MAAPEPPPPPDFGLAAEVLAVLPSDPFAQLDVARKITSIALATRISNLESEAARLRQRAAEKDDVIAELRAQVETLDASLADLSRQLQRADQEKENLLNENASLSNTVKKLNRDVSKLATFRKTLMQSLQEEEEGSQVATSKVARQQITDAFSFSTESLLGEEDAALAPSKLSSVKTQISDVGTSSQDAVSKDSISQGSLLASCSSTPSLSPPRSPPRLSMTRSPTRWSNPVSPRRHSISMATTNDRSSIYSSMPSSLRSSMSSPFDTESHTGRTRVDGKEFFRQVRGRLSYEQFSAFLANVKELNLHKQTKEETLRKADEIFGPDNKDLYAIFEGLINRNLH